MIVNVLVIEHPDKGTEVMVLKDVEDTRKVLKQLDGRCFVSAYTCPVIEDLKVVLEGEQLNG